ncbi:MAG: TetR/AcrR family transcriptional regulator [Sandaracinus sp.]|nr:TetR/AcrR family transcriptional regulator [Sandaracinus sp.]MCB9631411.1 TetR/AcrR family transcriptional regulator [Sandaracinus sp.]
MLRSDAAPGGRRHQANLERVLDAASELAFEDGLEAMSIKRVAERAGYSPGALYRYFASKDAIVVAIMVRAIDALTASLQAVEAADPLGRLVAQSNAYRTMAEREPHAFALVSKMSADPRVLVVDDADAGQVVAAVERLFVPIVRSFLEAERAGLMEPGPAHDRALALFAALQGSLHLRKQERRMPHVIVARRVFDTALRALLRGFGAPVERVDAALAAHASTDA